MVGVNVTGFWPATSLRRDLRQILVVAALLAVLGGVSLFALAGARRTQSSYTRFLRDANPSTMAVAPGLYDLDANAAIAGRPEVVGSATSIAFITGPLVNGRPDFEQDFETIGTLDGRFFTSDRFTPTSGRMPDVDAVDEIAVNETTAELYGYQVGQQLELGTYSAEQTETENFFDDPPPPQLQMVATIVAIGVFTDEVVQDDTNRAPLALVTPAFTERAAAYATYAWQGLTLRNGDADVPALKEWYVGLLDPDAPQFFRVTSVDTYHAVQATRPLTLALALFGVVAAVATVVLAAQSIGRWLRRLRAEQDALRSIGASPRDLLHMALVGPLVAVAFGVLSAVGVAIVLSPLMPMGPVRRVEVTRGFDVDVTALVAGSTVLFVVLGGVTVGLAAASLPHRRLHGQRAIRRSRSVDAAASAGLPPSAVTGIRSAFVQDGAVAVPVRSVMIGIAVAIAATIAAVTFGSSFHTLLDTPGLYGWDWDVAINDQSGYGNIDIESAHRVLDGNDLIEDWSGAYFGADSVDGHNLALLGMDLGSVVTPPLLDGRMIRAADEIVLGSATADDLGKHVGDDVTIGVGTETSVLRVVGEATLPAVGILHGAHTSLGVGALVVPDLIPGFARQATGDGPPVGPAAAAGPPVLFIRFAQGADRRAALTTVSEASGEISQYPGSSLVIGPQRPAEIVNSTDIGRTPAMLALALAAAAAVSLAVALAASVRRQRRDYAMFQAIGFTRRQLDASVAWQATTTVGVGLVAGVPAGVILGRVLWSGFAEQLNVVSRPTVPVALVVAAVVAALVIANLAASVPARMARRVRPAIALRTE